MGGETDEHLWQAPKGHFYPLLIIQLGIAQVMQCLTSLRGVQQTFELFAQYWAIPTPSFSNIRRWVLRLGLYELQREKTYRTDWIFILDLTIELGEAKCLVILGIPQFRWDVIVTQEQRGLQHQDVEVLDIEILHPSNGKEIERVLNQLSTRVGVPVQILSDHGSDLKKGVELYLSDKPEVIYTYDVTHWLALQLKAELAGDERYQSFVQQCSQCRCQLQQTELAGLMPPTQRTKARYFNVDRLVDWAQQILRYQQRNDFSHLSNEFTIDTHTLEVLAPVLDSTAYRQLFHLKGNTYANHSVFTETLSQHLGATVFTAHAQLISQTASVGRRRFQQKLGWLKDYQIELNTYSQMVEFTHQLERQLKHQGINSNSLSTFIKATFPRQLSPRLQSFYSKFIPYLLEEGDKVPKDKSLLATSDIIESLFGKYKRFSAKSCLKEIGPMILTIPLCTIEITTDLVKQAMETIRGIDVEHWLGQRLGQSMLSKRKDMFKPPEKDTKIA